MELNLSEPNSKEQITNNQITNNPKCDNWNLLSCNFLITTIFPTIIANLKTVKNVDITIEELTLIMNLASNLLPIEPVKLSDESISIKSTILTPKAPRELKPDQVICAYKGVRAGPCNKAAKKNHTLCSIHASVENKKNNPLIINQTITNGVNSTDKEIVAKDISAKHIEGEKDMYIELTNNIIFHNSIHGNIAVGKEENGIRRLLNQVEKDEVVKSFQMLLIDDNIAINNYKIMK